MRSYGIKKKKTSDPELRDVKKKNSRTEFRLVCNVVYLCRYDLPFRVSRRENITLKDKQFLIVVVFSSSNKIRVNCIRQCITRWNRKMHIRV